MLASPSSNLPTIGLRPVKQSSNLLQKMKKRILILISILIQCSVLMAQNYTYSVTTGTSWCRDVYPQIERSQIEAMSHADPLPGAPNFGQIFSKLSYIYRQSDSYNDSIYYDLSHEEWINMFKRRAINYAQFYEENNTMLSQIQNYFKQKEVPEAAYDSLFFYTRQMYHRSINDVFLYEQFMDILVPHYEKLEDEEHLVFCYMCQGLLQYQSSRMGEDQASMRSERCYHKVLNMKERFADFKDPLNRYYFIAAYVNLAVLHTQAGNISINGARDITQQVLDVYHKPEIQKIFRRDSLLNAFATWSYDLFRLHGITSFISQRVKNDALRDDLYRVYKEFKEEIGSDFGNLKNHYYSKLEYDDALIEAYMGHISWDEAHLRLRDLLAKDPDMSVESTSVPSIRINYLNNMFESSVYVLERTHLSQEEKKESMKIMLNRLLSFVRRYEHSRYPFEKGMILSNIARKSELLQYLNAQERKELIYRLIVLEQPTTYVHVSMVATMAHQLAEFLIDRQPEYFLSMPNFSSVEDVQAKRDSLLSFIHDAAIFHDLGKITMPMVVNNCIRKLSDHEYRILELHPEKSRPFFAVDPSLKPYQDIALGHHKWYNGKGYPSTYRNLKSPYYPIICLVTVCDCLDAATENIGRNYHRPKPFVTVLHEFIKESGTRYNPQIIDFIRWNIDVQLALKKIVSDGRYDHYYELYTGYMQKSN